MDHIRLDHDVPAADHACPAPVDADAPGDDEVALAFARTRSIAIVGASPHPSRTSYQIAVWLMENTPYELFLVNPQAEGEEIRGHGFYGSLDELPAPVDMVDVFRRAEHTPAIAVDAVRNQAKCLWLQLGVRNAEAMATARTNGLVPIQNRCIKVEYRRLQERIQEFRAV
ncbi:CoA-binding protein [Demequina sp.]|uniref:CoA-binding protein n=1 Tax=Demequina sp. TaxID=2050685 RepID=UPI0025D85B10|nr:CoA-binding protein [Demequina sp.]